MISAAFFLCAALGPSHLSGQDRRAVYKAAGYDISAEGDLQGFRLELTPTWIAEGLDVVAIKLTSPAPQPPPRFTLKWSLPSHDVVGQWATGRQMNKTIRPDWSGGRLQASMFAREAPVSCLFGSNDGNVLTFAVSDALDTILIGSGIREEDGLIYNDITFFSEPHPSLTQYAAELRIDRRAVPYWTALKEVGEWWARQPGYEPARVPEPARQPVYSTWYSYHQSVDAAVLLKEVAIAKRMGFESIIVDDGWQTLDSARGYAYTGDWQPERMPDMKGFVDGCHALGVKVVLWYAVPFVGKNAKVADRFKDESLRFEDRLGAYVLDPRYPDVRRYLIDVYRKAIQDWGIDGFKLDFIERFAADEKTVLDATGGRDFASVNEATDRMMTDILAELRKVKPDVMIEFRQPYIGPLIRKYGNMFRASDCPNSYLANRVKTVDLRLLSGNTAVHADMIMWHYGEPVEIAAFQLLNVLFSVPQVSVRLQEIPRDHFAMVRFYTSYWRENRPVLLDGAFEALAPAANYPVLIARGGDKQIVGVYGDTFVRLDARSPAKIDLVNAKNSETLVLAAGQDLGTYRYAIRDCQGNQVASGQARLGKGTRDFQVPVSGLLSLERLD
ncbi:MAG TPA: glycoside hydrolase family 36 protein [Vicinamibacteria bacterium]